MPKQYRLPYMLKAPSEETENMYLAEVPVLPGCRAWGATADEALLNLEGVAADFIASCEDSIPLGLTPDGGQRDGYLQLNRSEDAQRPHDN